MSFLMFCVCKGERVSNFGNSFAYALCGRPHGQISSFLRLLRLWLAFFCKDVCWTSIALGGNYKYLHFALPNRLLKNCQNLSWRVGKFVELFVICSRLFSSVGLQLFHRALPSIFAGLFTFYSTVLMRHFDIQKP